MSKGKAIALAVFTAWPILYMFLFIVVGFGFTVLGIFSGGHFSEPPILVMIIFPLHFLTMLEMMGLMVIYIVHLFKTDRVPQDKKALWAVVLLLGNVLAMPVYWYFYIWKEPDFPLPPSRHEEDGSMRS